MASSEWYYKVKNKVVGPVNNKQLLDLIKSGKVKRDTLIRKSDSKWIAAITVTGLFQKAGVITAGDHRCPYCGVPIEDPPTTCDACKRRVEGPGEQVGKKR